MRRLMAIVVAIVGLFSLAACGVSEADQMDAFVGDLRARGFVVVSQGWDTETKSKTVVKNRKTSVKTTMTRIMEAVVDVNGCRVEMERIEDADPSSYVADEVIQAGQEIDIPLENSPRLTDVRKYLHEHRGQFKCYTGPAS